MSENQILNILKNVKAFKGLTENELQLFSNCCKKVAFKKDDIITKEGSKEISFSVIVKGVLKVFLPQEIEGLKDQRISDIKLNILKEGDCFGEYSLIKKSQISASIIAMDPGELIKISEDDFNKLLDSDVHIAKIIYHNLLCLLIDRLGEREKEFDLVLISN